MKRRKYRIIKYSHKGYEAQYWRWWFPFWLPIDISNSHNTIKEAKAFIKKHNTGAAIYINPETGEEESMQSLKGKLVSVTLDKETLELEKELRILTDGKTKSRSEAIRELYNEYLKKAVLMARRGEY